MKLTFHQIRYHRNGVCGAPFHVMRFTDPAEGPMLGIVFAETHHVAVLNLDRLHLRDIGFGSNSWRGDDYEPHLRQAIRESEADEAERVTP